MAETRTAAGTIVRHPDEVSVLDLSPEVGGVRAPIRAMEPEISAVLTLLEQAGLDFDDGVELDVPVAAAGLRAGPVSGPVELDVRARPGGVSGCPSRTLWCL